MSKEGEEYEGKAGFPCGYFVIMNKINIVLFFCIIHVIFFKIQMHDYFCFCSVQFPKLLFLLAARVGGQSCIGYD